MLELRFLIKRMANGGEHFIEHDLCGPFDIQDGLVERRGALHESAVLADGGRGLEIDPGPCTVSLQYRPLEDLLYRLNRRLR